jgi:hypothetical protein
MYQAKTKPAELSVSDYLNAIEDETRRKDCEKLSALMKKLTKCKAIMWGSSIVGFDSYHYEYASGHQGDSCLVGFSSRKGDISIYLVCGYDSDEAKKLLSQLGKHKIGKACLYIKRLSDIDLAILEKLAALSMAETRRRHPAKK